jgi:hypothetical protein
MGKAAPGITGVGASSLQPALRWQVGFGRQCVGFICGCVLVDHSLLPGPSTLRSYRKKEWGLLRGGTLGSTVGSTGHHFWGTAGHAACAS